MDTEHAITAAIEKILAGNRDEFRVIVSLFQGKVYSTAFQATNDKKEAEDLAQEIFLKAYRSLAQFRFESSFSTWLYTIAIRKSMDWKRKHSKIPMTEELTSQTAEVDMKSQRNCNNRIITIEEEIINKETKDQVHKLVEELPEHYRQVMQMYHFQEMTYREIAEELDIPEKTVETRLYRAKQKLKDQKDKEEFA